MPRCCFATRTSPGAAMAVIERGIGRPGDAVEPIPVPAGASLAERAQAIADAAMQGACSVAQAASLLSCLASVAKVREVEELEARIQALEAAAAPGGTQTWAAAD